MHTAGRRSIAWKADPLVSIRRYTVQRAVKPCYCSTLPTSHLVPLKTVKQPLSKGNRHISLGGSSSTNPISSPPGCHSNGTQLLCHEPQMYSGSRGRFAVCVRCLCVCVLGGQEAHSTFQPLPQSSAPSSLSLPGPGSRGKRTVGNVHAKARPMLARPRFVVVVLFLCVKVLCARVVCGHALYAYVFQCDPRKGCL